MQIEHLFEYRLAGYAADGRAVGEFIASGARPKFHEKLRLVAGASVDAMLAAGRAVDLGRRDAGRRARESGVGNREPPTPRQVHVDVQRSPFGFLLVAVDLQVDDARSRIRKSPRTV